MIHGGRPSRQVQAQGDNLESKIMGAYHLMKDSGGQARRAHARRIERMLRQCEERYRK